MIDELTIIQKLKGHDIKAFKVLCVEFSEILEDFAFSLIGNANKAGEIVTDVLGRSWATGAFANVSPPILDFLREEVRKACSKES